MLRLEREQLVAGAKGRLTPEEKVLWRLLLMGCYDGPEEEGEWHSAIRSMRHSSAMGHQLWTMLEKEHIRVRMIRGPSLIGD